MADAGTSSTPSAALAAASSASAKSEPTEACQLDSLPTELVVAIASTLPKAQNLLALSSTSWTLRRAIVSTDSAVAWDALAARAYGAQCIELTRRAHWWQPPPSGFALYRGCAAFLRAVAPNRKCCPDGACTGAPRLRASSRLSLRKVKRPVSLCCPRNVAAHDSQ